MKIAQYLCTQLLSFLMLYCCFKTFVHNVFIDNMIIALMFIEINNDLFIIESKILKNSFIDRK